MGKELDKSYQLGERALLIINGERYSNIGSDGLTVIINNFLEQNKSISALGKIKADQIKNVQIPEDIKNKFDIKINKKTNKVVIRRKNGN